MAATRIAQIMYSEITTDLMSKLCALTRLSQKAGEDFKIEYYFADDGTQKLIIEIIPTNEWSKLAFKTFHEIEIVEEAKENAKTAA